MKSRCVAILLTASLAITARAQIPSLGFCPEYLPMTGFDMEKFAGIWYEAERYFQLTEVASRCVMSNYTKGNDNKYHVLNEVTSRFTGIKRVLEGEIRKPASKADAGKLHVKYTTVPLIPLETQYNVLETDYDNYAVLWSCSGVGPVHTQNAWIMTRQRLAPGEILQKAYGVLDKYKISKVFFVKTNQEDCAYLDNLQAEQAAKPTEPPKKSPAPPASEASEDSEEYAPSPILGKSNAEVREHITPDAPEAIIQTRKAEIEAKQQLEGGGNSDAAALEAVQADAATSLKSEETGPLPESVKSVPEFIMKIADQAKEQLLHQSLEPAQEPHAEISEPLGEEAPLAPVIPVAVVASPEDAKKAAPVVSQELKKETEPELKAEIVEGQVEIATP